MSTVGCPPFPGAPIAAIQTEEQCTDDARLGGGGARPLYLPANPRNFSGIAHKVQPLRRCLHEVLRLLTCAATTRWPGDTT